MEYIKIPNLPDKKVNTVLISPKCPKYILDELGLNQINHIKTEHNRALQDATAAHPDMSILHLGNNQFICDKNALHYYKTRLIGADITAYASEISSKYPYDAGLNVGIVGKFAFLNPKSINEQIFDILTKSGFKICYTNQGYAKCNIVTVSNNAIITEDASIYKSALSCGLDVLLIAPGNVSLTGYKHGFIGGACGKLNIDTLAITGSLEYIPERNSIKSFCKNHGVDIFELSKHRPCDLGSILPILQF